MQLRSSQVHFLVVHVCVCVFMLLLIEFLLLFQSITLKEACKSALTILKQVMEEKLNSTNVEVLVILFSPCSLHPGLSVSGDMYILVMWSKMLNTQVIHCTGFYCCVSRHTSIFMTRIQH